MNHNISKKLIFYYLTEDPLNLKELNEISYLSSIGRVVVATSGDVTTLRRIEGIKILNLKSQSRFVIELYFLWLRICFLFCCPVESASDKNFPLRNVYAGNKFLQFLVNQLWHLKYLKFVNGILPSYEFLYFAPFRFANIFTKRRRILKKNFNRVLIHDSLILRLTKFTQLILIAKSNDLPTIANVKSWDNPYYSQFTRNASGFLTWSQNMWDDIQRIQKVKSICHHSWGPRAFYDFARAVEESSKPLVNSNHESLSIGYAAAFCDEHMAANEVKLIQNIALEISRHDKDIKILFRPYPTVPFLIYEQLQALPNIEIIDIKGEKTDRFNDGREVIRFGSNKERIEFLSRCNYFMSIGSSFTFEAAIFGLPIIQYFKPKECRVNIYEKSFFERLDISDHIANYFLKCLPVAKNVPELIALAKDLEEVSLLKNSSRKLISLIGVPNELNGWNNTSNSLVKNIKIN